MKLSYLIVGVLLGILAIAAIRYVPELFDGADEVRLVEEKVGDEAQLAVEEVAGADIPSPTETAALEPAVEDLQEGVAETEPPAEVDDGWIQRELTALGVPGSWLARADLLDRGASVLVNAARGELPRRQLTFMVPAEPYVVDKIGEGDNARFFVNPEGYQRYDQWLDRLDQTDPAVVAGLLQTLAPALDIALKRLGERDQALPLLDNIFLAIEEAEVPVGDIELLRPSVNYEYADPDLEGQGDFSKQLMRLGPENLSRLKQYAAAVKAALAA